jgi:polysaccharide deacetylase 2 family uncharacterized protein YibQ
VTRKTDRLDSRQPARSARRSQAAVRRTRRASGLPSETFGERVARGARALGASRIAHLGSLWSAALAVGVAGGLWFGMDRPQVPDERIPSSLRSSVAAVRVGPPNAELAAAAPRETAPVSAGQAAAAARGVELAETAGEGELPAAAVSGEPARSAEAPLADPAPPLARLPDPPLAAPDTGAAVGEGQPAWLANAAPVALRPHRPMIAVVIDDLGLNRPATRATIALPGPLNLAFLAYAEELSAQAEAGRRAGHETLLHTPMEPIGDEDPGPNALMADLPAAENLRRLSEALAKVPGIVGINNHMGSRFTASESALRPVLAELKHRGLLFLDSRTSGGSVGDRLAGQLGLPHVARDVFLDHDVEAGQAYVEDRLAEVEAIARSHGAAVAIGHPHEGTLAALRAWLPALEARGFQLVPISAVVRAREAHQLAARGD